LAPGAPPCPAAAGPAADPAPFPSMLVIYNGTDRRS